MEDVLEVYHRPCDPRRPVVCVDEKNVQLLGQTRTPLPPRPGDLAKEDHEYQRNGTVNLFVAFEPLGQFRHIEVTARRTKVDFAWFLRTLVDGRYAAAEKIVVVMDNLNTHTPASLYEAFPPAEARRILEKLEIHYTPKHGSWLNMAEIELSAIGRALGDRVADAASLRERLALQVDTRNRTQRGATWHFTTADARVRLAQLYPRIELK
jgi:hypothetical protein